MKKIKHIIVKETDYVGIFICTFLSSLFVTAFSVMFATFPFIIGIQQVFDDWIANWILAFTGVAIFIITQFYMSNKFAFDIKSFETERVEHIIIERDKHG
jgi:hypothetical protein